MPEDSEKFGNIIEELVLGIKSPINQLKKTVLIHCAAGISRSSAVTIAFMMYYYTMTLEEAFHYVKERHQSTCPNKGFFAELLKFELKLLKKNSCTIDDYYKWIIK